MGEGSLVGEWKYVCEDGCVVVEEGGGVWSSEVLGGEGEGC